MSLILTIKVIPNAGKQLFSFDKAGTLKCHLKSLPEQGKANKELLKLLSKTLRIPQNNLEIIHGATQRTKKIKIETLQSRADIVSQLGIPIQTTLIK